jgi:hypothetical protein
MATYYVRTTGNNANAGTSEGAAWADPGYASGNTVSGDIIWIDSGTYTLTTSTPNVAGGPISIANSVAKSFIGYKSSLGIGVDPGADKPVISAGSVTGITIMAFLGSQAYWAIAQWLKVDGNSGASNIGMAGSGSNIWATAIGCESVNCPGGGLLLGQLFGCRNVGGGGIGLSGRFGADLVSSGGAIGIRIFEGGSRLLAYGNSGDGVQLALGGVRASRVTCDQNGNGLDAASGDIVVTDSIFTRNTGGGVRSSGSARSRSILVGCAFYSNGNAHSSVNGHVYREHTLTSLPYIDAASGDYRLNDTAGGGLELRDAIDAGAVAGFSQGHDIGAFQFVGSGGGSGGGRPRIGNIW